MNSDPLNMDDPWDEANRLVSELGRPLSEELRPTQTKNLYEVDQILEAQPRTQIAVAQILMKRFSNSKSMRLFDVSRPKLIRHVVVSILRRNLPWTAPDVLEMVVQTNVASRDLLGGWYAPTGSIVSLAEKFAQQNVLSEAILAELRTLQRQNEHSVLAEQRRFAKRLEALIAQCAPPLPAEEALVTPLVETLSEITEVEKAQAASLVNTFIHANREKPDIHSGAMSDYPVGETILDQPLRMQVAVLLAALEGPVEEGDARGWSTLGYLEGVEKVINFC